MSIKITNTVEQDMWIFRLVAPYDKILKNSDAVFEEDTVYASSRVCAVWKLNEMGYRVLQFIPSGTHGTEWVLVESYI